MSKDDNHKMALVEEDDASAPLLANQVRNITPYTLVVTKVKSRDFIQVAFIKLLFYHRFKFKFKVKQVNIKAPNKQMGSVKSSFHLDLFKFKMR